MSRDPRDADALAREHALPTGLVEAAARFPILRVPYFAAVRPTEP